MSRGCSNFVKFQSTLPRGERLAQYVIYYNHRNISIHAPARGATTGARSDSGNCTISIHAPARGATQHRHRTHHSQHNFNPRSREGSDPTSSPFSPPIKISIHAPARGATVFARFFSTLYTISIHAPARGATSILSKIHPMFLTISHNASSFSSFPFHSFLPHLLNSSTFCALFQVRISRAFSVYYRFAPKKSTPDL